MVAGQGCWIANTMRTTVAGLVLLPSILLLAACVSSGVVKTGPGTYMIANSEWGVTSGGYQKAKVISEADKYCASLGKEIVITGSKQQGVAFAKVPSAEVEFKCIPKGASALSKRTSPAAN